MAGSQSAEYVLEYLHQKRFHLFNLHYDEGIAHGSLDKERVAHSFNGVLLRYFHLTSAGPSR